MNPAMELKVREDFLVKIRALDEDLKWMSFKRKNSLSKSEKERVCERMKELFASFYEILLFTEMEMEYELLANFLAGIISGNLKINRAVFNEVAGQWNAEKLGILGDCNPKVCWAIAQIPKKSEPASKAVL